MAQETVEDREPGVVTTTRSVGAGGRNQMGWRNNKRCGLTYKVEKSYFILEQYQRITAKLHDAGLGPL